jgi:hypothetical protein
MRQALKLAVIATLAAVVIDCGPKVMVPPVIDLKEHEIIGIIQFTSSNQGQLGPLATRKFTESARRDQGIIRVVELGSEAEVLRAIGHDRLDPDAFKALGEKYQVSTIITGEVVVSDVRPDLSITPGGGFVSLAAEVDASLTARMTETETGASIWSSSAEATRRVGNVSVFGKKDVAFDAQDPEKAYGKLIDELVEETTRDFRVTWERK